MLAFFLERFDDEADKRSFTAIYQKYENYLIKVSKEYLYDGSFKVDCMQETFLQLIKNYETFSKLSEKEQKIYLITICRRCAYRINEKTSAFNTKAFEELSSKEERVLSYFDSYHFDEEELVYAIKALDIKYSLPLIMKYAEGYSVKEISAELEINENLVLQRIYRGKKKIVEKLSGKEGNESG